MLSPQRIRPAGHRDGVARRLRDADLVAQHPTDAPSWNRDCAPGGRRDATRAADSEPPPVRLPSSGSCTGTCAGSSIGSRGGRTCSSWASSIRTRRCATVSRAIRPGAPTIFHATIEAMLDAARPQAVAIFTSTYDHPQVVEACAARGVHVMMEKPLAVSIAHARRIADAAARGRIQVLVNYETTWYASNRAVYDAVKAGTLGPVRKMVAHDGHRGPQEIGVQPEFLRLAHRPRPQRRRRPHRLRLLRGEPVHLADGRRAAGLRERGGADLQARGLSARRRRGHDRRGLAGGGGDHPGVVELALRPQGPRGLRPHRARPSP